MGSPWLFLLGVLGLGASLAVARSRPRLASVLTSAVLLLALFAALGRLYGAPAFGEGGRLAGIGALASVALIVLAGVTAFALPEGPLHWVLRGHDVGALLVRRTMPLVFVVVPALGYARLEGANRDLYGIPTGVTVMVVAMIAVIGVTTLSTARRLSDIDDSRRAATDALADLNAALEERVRVRSEELQAEHARVQLLEERERIARELHARLVQRLSSAQMRVESAAARTDDPGVRPVLLEATSELDAVFVELRRAISDLPAL